MGSSEYQEGISGKADVRYFPIFVPGTESWFNTLLRRRGKKLKMSMCLLIVFTVCDPQGGGSVLASPRMNSPRSAYNSPRGSGTKREEQQNAQRELQATRAAEKAFVDTYLKDFLRLAAGEFERPQFILKKDTEVLGVLIGVRATSSNAGANSSSSSSSSSRESIDDWLLRHLAAYASPAGGGSSEFVQVWSAAEAPRRCRDRVVDHGSIRFRVEDVVHLVKAELAPNEEAYPCAPVCRSKDAQMLALSKAGVSLNASMNLNASLNSSAKNVQVGAASGSAAGSGQPTTSSTPGGSGGRGVVEQATETCVLFGLGRSTHIDQEDYKRVYVSNCKGSFIYLCGQADHVKLSNCENCQIVVMQPPKMISCLDCNKCRIHALGDTVRRRGVLSSKLSLVKDDFALRLPL